MIRKIPKDYHVGSLVLTNFGLKKDFTYHDLRDAVDLGAGRIDGASRNAAGSTDPLVGPQLIPERAIFGDGLTAGAPTAGEGQGAGLVAIGLVGRINVGPVLIIHCHG